MHVLLCDNKNVFNVYEYRVTSVIYMYLQFFNNFEYIIKNKLRKKLK